MAQTQEAVYVDETNKGGERKGKVQFTRSKEVPTPSEREVLVKMKLRPINPAGECTPLRMRPFTRTSLSTFTVLLTCLEAVWLVMACGGMHPRKS